MKRSPRLATALEQKYGVRVNHWRGSAEKIVSRALAEARARRHEADLFETSSHRIEALYRERLLEDFHTPVLRDIVPEAFRRGGAEGSRSKEPTCSGSRRWPRRWARRRASPISGSSRR